MVGNHKSLLQKMGDYRRRVAFFSLVLVFAASISVTAQDNNYWANATTGSTKIFTIYFTDEQNGEALSVEGNLLLTHDGGYNWMLDSENSETLNKIEKLYWKADIYCSIMQSTDGGETWVPYDKESQEHFCGVYFKDENTGHDIANQFLNKVTRKVFTNLNNNEINSLIDHPQQCTEYFLSPTEGWALGWCIRNFNGSEY